MRARTPHPAAGFTLVELMVGLTIGLLLLAGVLQIMLSNRESFEAQQATSQVQDNLRLAEFVLSHSVAHAGFRSDLNVLPINVFPATTDGILSFAGGAAVSGASNVRDGNDILRIRYQGRGGIRDCRGTDIGSPSAPVTADFEFHVNADKTLICHVITTNDYQPIADNVMRFEVQYGLDIDDTAGVDRYVEVLTQDQQPAVRSVRIRLLLASEDDSPSLPEPVERIYRFDGEGNPDYQEQTFNDRRIYMLMDETIAIPNMAL